MPLAVIAFLAWAVCAHGWLEALAIALAGLSGAGMALGYWVWMFISIWSGMTTAPKRAWIVSREGAGFRVSDGELAAELDVRDVERAIHVIDIGWDRLRTIEDALIVHIAGGLPLRIPESAEGISELLAELECRHLLTKRFLEC